MNRKVPIIVFIFLSYITCMAQNTEPLTLCEIQQHKIQINLIKSEKVRSRITWLQDSENGFYQISEKKIMEEQFNADGYPEEIIYFGKDEKTDSIQIIENNNLGYPIKIITFDPLGNTLETIKYIYNDQNLLQEVRYTRNNQKPYLFVKITYRNDSIIKWNLASGTTVISKVIRTELQHNNCDSISVRIQKFNTNNEVEYECILTSHNHILTINEKKPEIRKIIQTTNAFNLPVKKEEINELNKIINSVIYQYHSNGLIMGIAEYDGIIKEESGNKNYDILDNTYQESRSSLIKLMKYTYKYF